MTLSSQRTLAHACHWNFLIISDSWIFFFFFFFLRRGVKTNLTLSPLKVYPFTSSRKHAYIILTPLNPTFYIVKLGFARVYIIFLISAQNIDCGYSLEPQPSNEYPQSMFEAEIWKILEFLSELSHFLVVKFSVYLNRCVFVMLNMPW